jgi:Protein of unknown function (DUF3078)
MKKIYFITMILIATCFASQAQESEDVIKEHNEIQKTLDEINDTTPPWDFGGAFNVNITHVSLTNWAAGGENSLAGNTSLNIYLNYKKNKSSWDNTLDLGYGILKQGEENLRKSDDKIDFSTKYGRLLNEKTLFLTAMGAFKTQFMPGFNYPNDSVQISNFMAPAYSLISLGIDYKPNDNISIFIAPITGKTTFVFDDTLSAQGAFGVEEGENIRNEFGGFVKIVAKKEINENISASSKLELFSNYIEDPQNIDINWEVLVSLKITKFISATLNTQLIYDDDIKIDVDNNNDGIIDAKGPRVQFKEIIGIGFMFKF